MSPMPETDPRVEALLTRLERDLEQSEAHLAAMAGIKDQEPVDLLNIPERLWTRTDRRRVDRWLATSKRIIRAADRHWRVVERDRAEAEALAAAEPGLEHMHRLAAVARALAGLHGQLPLDKGQ